MRHFELLVDGRTVPVVGEDPDAFVEAWRVPQWGVFTLGRTPIGEAGEW